MRYHRQQAYLRARYRQAGGSRLSVVLRTFAFLVMGVCLALFYVWQNVQLVRVGYRIKEKEKIVMELTKRTKSLEIDLSMLKMPSRILSKIKDDGLELNIPELSQIVRIQEEPILYEEDLMNMDVNYEHFGSGTLIDVSKKSLYE
jgi:cell division protein FtsL